MVSEPPGQGYASWSVAGWSGPQPLWWLCLVAGVAVLVLIVSGPVPWRATRWAWFWMLALAFPFGLIAYVLLGGPLGRMRPADGARRMTGGWAFLVAWVVFASYRERIGT